MPRAPRFQLSGATYHVTAHGVDDRDIYRDDGDRETFSSIFAALMRRRRWVCTGYCFMSNHYHLIVQTHEPDLGAGMQWLNGTYAASFNRRHGRRGHLFQERYGSVLIQTEAHFMNCYHYLALNPVKARLVSRPENWRWSSYGALIGSFAPPSYLSVGQALAPFGRDRAAARAVLSAIVAAGLAELQHGLAAWLLTPSSQGLTP